jgi:hypothetical protein
MPYDTYLASGGTLRSLTGTATEPIPQAFLVGAYTPTVAGFQSLSATAGPLTIRRIFNSNVPANWPGTGSGNDGNTGQDWTVCQSVKAPPLEIIAGDWDAEIVNFVAGGPTDKPWYLSIWHEPEEKAKVAANASDWPQGGLTFKAVHQRMYPLVKAANPMVRMGPIYTYWDWRPGGEVGENRGVGWRPQDWILDPAYCDFYGLDEYNASTTSGRTSLATSPSAQRWYGYVNQLGSATKPIAIPEWGRFANPNDLQARARDIADSAAWLRSTGRCLFWAYWHAIGIEGQYELNDQPSLNAWRSAALSGGTP